MGAIPPLNLCYVAADVRAAGHDVRLIDLQTEFLTFDELIAEIKDYAPDLIGSTITTYLFHPVREWLEAIKERVSGIPIMVGGFHLSLYPRETMLHDVFDFAVKGSSSESVPKLLEYVDQPENYSLVPGLCYRVGGDVVINDVSAEDGKLFDKRIMPARDLLDNSMYGNFISRRKNFTAMLTGTGCPFSCKYCATTLSTCVMRSPEDVVDELEECYHKYGVREIDFYDQSFTISKKRTIAICEEMIRRGLDFLWTVRTRADLIDDELLSVMKRAGLYRVMYGIESGSQKMLDRMNKRESLEEVCEVVRMTKKHGINVLGFFMMGCPGETEETLRATEKLALSLPFDEIQCTRFTLFPGTAFYDEYLEATGEDDYWREYIAGRVQARTMPLFDTDFTVEEIDERVRKLYLRFFLRPRIIVRKIFLEGGWKMMGRYVQALVDMIKG